MNFISTSSGKSTFIFIVITSIVLLLICLRVNYLNHQRKLFITNFYDGNDDNNTIDGYFDAQFREKMQLVNYVMNAKYAMNVINKRQKLYNVHSLGPVKKCTPILVIQVHANVFYFKKMLDSLRKMMGITKSLLIFAHDYFDNQINTLINDITFAKYVQIFYPYSVQMHPRVFPGNDRRYCFEGFKCIDNANRRDAVLAQRKLFWWWLLNKVFNRLHVTIDYNGTIIFLEEDNIVTEDLIYVLRLLERISSEGCPHCEIYNLGAYAASFEHYKVQNAYAVIEGWSSKVKSIGIAFNRTVWNFIRSYSYEYCYFNDHSWENSMRYVGTKKSNRRFLLMNVEGPRVFKIERCANNSYTMYCNMNYMVQKVQRYVKYIKRGLYPRNMIIRYNDYGIIPFKEEGFFSDVRDRELCMYFTIDK